MYKSKMDASCICLKVEKGTSLAHAAVADRLTVSRAISLNGDAQGSGQFDGSADVAIYTAVEKLTNEELEEILR